ncbi:hypothetical protein AgCh_035664 [Apium graveolens]
MDPDWISAMQEELNQFERNKVWELVPAPKNRSVIGTKWVFRNKMDESGGARGYGSMVDAKPYRTRDGAVSPILFKGGEGCGASGKVKCGQDAKVRHLLHSAIYNVMSNRIINCKTSKEIWDALETRCQGTDAIKKNRRTILTQEYEHFDSKPDESLTGLYDRFVKLLNDLSLVDKEYDLEDTNLKFLLALPES